MTKKEFEYIYRSHYADMYRLARTILYDADDCKDVVNDIFERLLRGDVCPQEDRIEGYLMTSVRNRCYDVLSHKSIRERVEKLFLRESSLYHIDRNSDDERLEQLFSFIESELQPLTQKIFLLRFLRGMSYEEVAQATGVSKVTVYNHLSNSLHRIRDYFGKDKAKL